MKNYTMATFAVPSTMMYRTDAAFQTAVVLRLASERDGFLKDGIGKAAMVEFLDCSSSAACCSMIRRSLAVSLVSKLLDVSLVTCKEIAM